MNKLYSLSVSLHFVLTVSFLRCVYVCACFVAVFFLLFFVEVKKKRAYNIRTTIKIMQIQV